MSATTRAEIAWVRGVIADLASGRLTWSLPWLKKVAAEWAARTTESSTVELAATGRRRKKP